MGRLNMMPARIRQFDARWMRTALPTGRLGRGEPFEAAE